MLNLSYHEWNATDFSMQFKGIADSSEFVERWKEVRADFHFSAVQTQTQSESLIQESCSSTSASTSIDQPLLENTSSITAMYVLLTVMPWKTQLLLPKS